MQKLLLICILMIYHSAWSQETNRAIYVMDENHFEAIPNVFVFTSTDNKAFQSDLNGRVLIQSKDSIHKMYTYHMSYNSESFDLNTVEDTLWLSMVTHVLPSMELKVLSPKEVVKKAIEAIPHYFTLDQHYLDGNYVQIHQENNQYVRYIEANVYVEKAGYDFNTKQAQEEKFAIQDIRKSYNYEQNGEQHGDHLVDLFAEDPVQYISNNMLNIKNIDLYNWNMNQQLQGVYSLEFQNKPWESSKNIVGVIFINPTDYTLLGINYSETPNITVRQEKQSSWEFMSGSYEIRFQKQGEIFTVDKIDKKYHHLVRHPSNPKYILYEVSEEFHWLTKASSPTSPNVDFTYKSNLYSLEMPYQSEGWFESSRLEDARSDLEHKHDIYYQFMNP